MHGKLPGAAKHKNPAAYPAAGHIPEKDIKDYPA